MARRVIITGAAGQLGRQLVRAFTGAGHEVFGLGHADLELADPAAGDLIASMRPEIVINAAAWTDVDGCAKDPDRAMLLNGIAPGRLAAGAARAGAFFVQISTNEVFDGTADRPYMENDLPNPVNPYGASKAAGEKSVAGSAPRHLIVRTAWLFGPGGSNFVTKILAAADRAAITGQPLRVVSDEWGNPTPARSFAMVLVQTMRGGAAGIVHLCGEPATSRIDWARVVLEAGRPGIEIQPISRAEFARVSTTPARAVLRQSDDLPRMTWAGETRAYVRLLPSPAPIRLGPT